MKTVTTDVALLGSSVVAGLTGMVHTYGSFAITAASAALIMVIRWQQHKQQLRNLRLDEEIKRKQLND